jgi:glyoxylase-like metal-dependent hydrolase (beta-lactamase superfamily II)
MQIFPNVYEITSTFGDRWIKQYLLVGGDQTLLLDAGIAETPNEVILPYLEKIAVSPRRISMALALHADADHHGGLPGIKDASAGTLLACGAADRELIENPEALYDRRYNFLAEKHGLGFSRAGMVNCPEGRKMDTLFSGGETIHLAKDWPLRVWHVPGHSAGHLAIYDEKHKSAYTSDAVQTNGYPTVTGGMAFGPTYYTVEAYLSTVHFLEQQPLEHIFSGHWPSIHDEAVSRFLASTREFVMRADEMLTRYLKARHGGVTLKEILAELGPKLGTWPKDSVTFLQFAMYGHLVRMEQTGFIRQENTNPLTYRLA